MKKFTVALTHKPPEPGFSIVREFAKKVIIGGDDLVISRGEFKRIVRDAQGLFAMMSGKIDGEILECAPGLKVLSLMTVGYDHVDLEYCKRRGIIVTNTGAALTETTADLVWALMMDVARRLSESERFLRAGKFIGWKPDLFLGKEVHGATLGIIGAGRIGQAVGRRASSFGMKILYAARSDKKAFERETGARRTGMQNLLQSADFVVCALPLSEETRHLISDAEFARMKHGAIIVNIGRGPTIDEEALVRALKSGLIFGAGLDVYEKEPAIHPDLLKMENVVLLPHIGSATAATRSRMSEIAAKNLVLALSGKRPLHRVI